jgi:zinc protease
VSAGLARVALCGLACVGCGRAPLPAPYYPLSRTVEEPFRAAIASPAPPAFEPPSAARFALSNGIGVTWIARPGSGLLSLSIVNRHAGEGDLGAPAGLATLTLDLLATGTRAHPGLSHAEALRAAGATFERRVFERGSALTVTALAEDAPRAVSLLSEAVLEPELAQRDFAGLLRTQAEHRRGTLGSSGSLARELALRALWGDAHENARASTGRLGDIARRTHSDVVQYFRRRYLPRHCEIVAAGEVTEAQLRAMLEPSFGRWSATYPEPALPAPPEAPPPTPPATPGPWRIVHRGDREQSLIVLGWRLAGSDDPSAAASSVLHEIFVEMQDSRVSRAVRERDGYVYTPAPSLDLDARDATSLLRLDVARSNVGPAIRAVLHEVERLRLRPPSAREVRAAQRRIRARVIGHFETVRSTCGALQWLALYGGSLASLGSWLARVDAVTPNAVHGAALRSLSASLAAVVVVGDRDALLSELATTSTVGVRVVDEQQ